MQIHELIRLLCLWLLFLRNVPAMLTNFFLGGSWYLFRLSYSAIANDLLPEFNVQDTIFVILLGGAADAVYLSLIRELGCLNTVP